MDDDEPRFETVRAPDEWPWTSDGPVRYLPVRGGRVLLGYLWAAESDDASGFVPAADAGDAGDNAEVAWVARLRAAKADGMTPLGVLAYWPGRRGDVRHGAVPRVAAGRAASLAVLRERAAAPPPDTA